MDARATSRRFLVRCFARLAPIPFAALAIGCGDYSGSVSSTPTGPVVVGGGSLGGLGFAEQVVAFEGTVYPLLRQYCSDCHAGAGPGTPHIAHSDPAIAYSSVVDNQKVNFTTPDASRIVRRLATDFHYCWSSCVADGAEMLAQVVAWDMALEAAGAQTGGGVDVASITSNQQTLADGIEDLGDTRDDTSIIARWEFKTGAGPTAFDTSGVAPAMDLTLVGAQWMSSYGIKIAEGDIAIADMDDSAKLLARIADELTGSGEYSVEAWITPANTTQSGDGGPARIVTYSRHESSINFTFGQQMYQYAYRNRTTDSSTNSRGDPALITYDADQDLQARLQHVVVTYDRLSGRRIYVDGVFTDDVDGVRTARLWNWDPRARFALGNEIGDTGHEWIGDIRFVAVYDRAIFPKQVLQNFESGIGKRLTLTFDIGAWGGPGTSIDFAVTQLDDYSYLFCQPTFRGANVVGLGVKDMRIQVNGTVPVEGQAFTNVDDTILTDGQQVSRQCSVIRSELGPDADSFQIVFEELGRFQTPVTTNTPSYVVSTAVLPPVPVLGIRDFARVRDTMAALTGVDPYATPQVLSVYQGLEQQLPGTSDLRSVVSSHQIGIAKLAFEFCHEMIEGTPSLATQFFGPGFEWNEVPSVAFSTAAKVDRITDPLIEKMLRYGAPGEDLTNQITTAEAEVELDQLIAELTVCNPAPCDATRTPNVVKGACTAVLSSAGAMVH